MIDITTTGRGYCDTSIQFTTHIATVSHQYMSLLLLLRDTPYEVHLMIFYFGLQKIHNFITFYFFSSQNFAYLTDSESIPL